MTSPASPMVTPSAQALAPSEAPERYPAQPLLHLDVLWIQVAGTLCNLKCTHCFVSAGPGNDRHGLMSRGEVSRRVAEGLALGVKEFYFTGGEPFMNPEMEAILEETLLQGPATVLTNGLLLRPALCERLGRLARESRYSLDLRISIDGFDAASNDAVRGAGTFARIARGIRNAAAAGLDPVITVTEVCCGAATADGRRRLLALLASLGLERPRLKILPLFRIGAEAARAGGYESWQKLGATEEPEQGWDHLQCGSCRMITDQGVWVCPILVNEPTARMGERLDDSLGPFALTQQACWTCHVQGASCRT
jgi:MoaA/NifB/PqqE/SkfB family radical SAM enzyme